MTSGTSHGTDRKLDRWADGLVRGRDRGATDVQIQRTRRSLAAENVAPLACVVGDALHIPLPSQSVDVVMTRSVRRTLAKVGAIFTVAVVVMAGVWPWPVASQEPPRRVGYLMHVLFAAQRDAFLSGLQNHGWAEGRVVVEILSAEGATEKLPELVDELLRRKVEVIVTGGTAATVAAKAASSTVPIVFHVADPVERGLVASLARPGGNITGLALLSGEGHLKRLQLLKEWLPRISRVAFLYGAANLPAQYRDRHLRDQQTSAAKLGIQLSLLPVRSRHEVPEAIDRAARDHAEALTVSNDALFIGIPIPALAAKHRLPAVYGTAAWVRAGGLISFGEDVVDIHRRSAYHVDRILRGARPADLPVEQASKFELVVNRKTATLLGLVIPRGLLLRADNVIE